MFRLAVAAAAPHSLLLSGGGGEPRVGPTEAARVPVNFGVGAMVTVPVPGAARTHGVKVLDPVVPAGEPSPLAPTAAVSAPINRPSGNGVH